jgi:hypothetical protein
MLFFPSEVRWLKHADFNSNLQVWGSWSAYIESTGLVVMLVPRAIRAMLFPRLNSPKVEPARQWHLHWEFEPSPSDPFQLFLLIKNIKAMVGKA